MKKNKIPFIDLKIDNHSNSKIVKGINELIQKSSFIGGETVERFEEEFAKFNKSKYCLGVANGTDALEIALESLDLPKNAEIIVPNFTFLSPAEAVIRGGYKLVLADINLNDFTICVDSLKKLISNKTKAIIIVHLFGNPCDMKEIINIKKKYDLKIIEDCSQSHGARFNSTNVGNFGDIGTFSFYPTKNLGAFGDAGALVFNDKKLFQRAKKISNHGRVDTYDHVLAGRNSRLDAIQAFILDLKLRDLKKINDKRNLQAAEYYKLLADSNSKLQNVANIKKSVYHQFPILSDSRDLLKSHLKKNLIDSGIYYPKPLSTMRAFKNSSSLVTYHDKNSIIASKNILSLPIGPHLNLNEISHVSKTILSFDG